MVSTSADNYAGRRRLAWFIVLIGFSIFLGLVVTIPILVSRYFQESVRQLDGLAYANQGTLSLGEQGQTPVSLSTSDGGGEISGGFFISTQAADSGLFTIQNPDSEDLLLRGQIYTNSSFELNEISTPRYQISDADNHIKINLLEGRLRLTLSSVDTERITQVSVQVPQGDVRILEPGEYAFDVQSGESQVSVLSGQVTVIADVAPNTPLSLNGEERSVLATEQLPAGPYSVERNLVENSDFSSGLDKWTVQEWSVERDDQPIGTTQLIETDGINGIRFSRQGEGHAESSIRQVLDQDVNDLALTLIVGLRINDQSLNVCGTFGSECPLTVRLDYEDKEGRERTWEQGFFATGDFSQGVPDTCVQCSPPYNAHMRIQPERFSTEEVDILETLRSEGLQLPNRLKSITVQMAGHSFETDLFEISIRVRAEEELN